MQTKTKEILLGFISNKKILLFIFLAFALAASIQALLLGPKSYTEGGTEYISYNNYQIFENSFYHLIQKKDLYQEYPQEYWDLYKYSPSFSVFFGVFAIFPDWLGLTLWNLLNAFVLLFSVYYLGRFTPLQKGFILLFCVIELMTSMQNQQSNGLIAGLLIFAFGSLEKQKYLAAAFCIVFSVYIKLFGIIAVIMFLFYPKKWKLALYSLVWFAVLFLLPLLFINFQEYMVLLSSWMNMLANDHSASYGYSVLGWLNSWFGLENIKISSLVAGLLMLLLPFLRIEQFKNEYFRYLMLSFLLIWVVIFNHKAESPTFIIAISGVALWFFLKKRNTLDKILFISAFILTSLSPTDIFPKFIRENFVIPYTLKAFPCILIWMKITYELLFTRNFPESSTVENLSAES